MMREDGRQVKKGQEAELWYELREIERNWQHGILDFK